MLYCGAACRAEAFRTRVRARRQPTVGEAGSTPERAAEGQNQRSSAKRGRPRRKNHPAQESRAQRLDSQVSEPRRPRIPFDRQVQLQAPQGTVAYRLVLPLRSHAELPKIAPAPDTAGNLRAWSLMPFELPDDIRLRDGHIYRILWVGSHGEPIPPKGTQQLPALFFFLGSADSDGTEGQDEYSSILRDVSDPQLRSECEAAVAKLRLQNLYDRQAAAAREQELAEAAAMHRLRQEAYEADRRRTRDLEEDAKRIATIRQEQSDAQTAAHRKAELQTMLAVAGTIIGMPTVSAVIQIIAQKIKGQPVDWPDLKRQLMTYLDKLPAVLNQAQQALPQSNPRPEAQSNSSSSTPPKPLSGKRSPGARIQR